MARRPKTASSAFPPTSTSFGEKSSAGAGRPVHPKKLTHEDARPRRNSTPLLDQPLPVDPLIATLPSLVHLTTSSSSDLSRLSTPPSSPQSRPPAFPTKRITALYARNPTLDETSSTEWKERIVEEQMRESRGLWALMEDRKKVKRVESWSMLSGRQRRKDRVDSDSDQFDPKEWISPQRTVPDNSSRTSLACSKHNPSSSPLTSSSLPIEHLAPAKSRTRPRASSRPSSAGSLFPFGLSSLPLPPFGSARRPTSSLGLNSNTPNPISSFGSKARPATSFEAVEVDVEGARPSLNEQKEMWWAQHGSSMGHPFVVQRRWGGDGMPSPVLSEYSTEVVDEYKRVRKEVEGWQQNVACSEAPPNERPFSTPVIIQHEKLDLQRLISADFNDLPMHHSTRLASSPNFANQTHISPSPITFTSSSPVIHTLPITPDPKAPLESSSARPARLSAKSNSGHHKSFLSSLKSVFTSSKRSFSTSKGKVGKEEDQKKG